MKKITVLLLVSLIALTAVFPPTVLAGEQPKTIPVFIDGLQVKFDVQPLIRSGYTMVPFRAIAEALNVKVTWDPATKTVNATDGTTSVRLQIGNTTAHRNNSPITLEAPPIIISGKTLIPLRFFSEAFGCKVAWEAATKTVRIASPPRKMPVIGFYALGDSKTSSWKNLFGLDYPGTAAGNTDIVDELALGWYSLDEQGSLLTKSKTGWQRPDGWEKVLAAAGEYNLKTEMVVHVTDGDGTITTLLSSETAMNKAVSDILAEAKQYRGVNLNFEGLGKSDKGEQLTAVRNSFTNFVRLLAEQLHGEGLSLSLSLHAPNSSYKGYDYKALGQIADRIIIMAYEYGQEPEPVNLVVQAVEQAKALVPPEKLSLGISAPSETPESILTKVGIAKQYNLNGIALWRLGVVPKEMWAALKTTVQARQ